MTGISCGRRNPLGIGSSLSASQRGFSTAGTSSLLPFAALHSSYFNFLTFHAIFESCPCDLLLAISSAESSWEAAFLEIGNEGKGSALVLPASLKHTLEQQALDAGCWLR